MDNLPDMSTSAPSPVGRKVKNVLTTLSDHGSQHLSEVETDLEQTVFLMSSAIEKLGQSFMAIHAAVMLQKETVDFLMAGNPPTPELEKKFKETHDAIGANVSEAVTGLQFQDMTSQLIFRTVNRVSGFREMLNNMESSGGAKLPAAHLSEIVDLLGEINKAIKEQSKSLDKRLIKAVSQTNMSSGDIELF
jgi:hypothetical protein